MTINVAQMSHTGHGVMGRRRKCREKESERVIEKEEIMRKREKVKQYLL